MKETYQKKILEYLMNEEAKHGSAVITSKKARMKFRKVNNIHNSIMRRARDMANDGLLKKIDRGTYELTPAGRRTYFSY